MSGFPGGGRWVNASCSAPRIQISNSSAIGVYWNFYDVGGWGANSQYSLRLGPFETTYSYDKTGPQNSYPNWQSGLTLSIGSIVSPQISSNAGGIGASNSATTYWAVSWYN